MLFIPVQQMKRMFVDSSPRITSLTSISLVPTINRSRTLSLIWCSVQFVGDWIIFLPFFDGAVSWHAFGNSKLTNQLHEWKFSQKIWMLPNLSRECESMSHLVEPYFFSLSPVNVFAMSILILSHSCLRIPNNTHCTYFCNTDMYVLIYLLFFVLHPPHYLYTSQLYKQPLLKF